jgi:threonine synthase
VAVSVPSGNFGNVLSGYVAKRMGLPLSRLVVATNENNVLAEFFESLVYRPRGSTETYVTSSPSMDISKASNFERYVFEMLNGDASALADLWRQLASTGQFSLADNQPVRDRIAASGLVAGQSSHAQRLAAISDIYSKYHRVIDPHTADGINVGRQYLRAGEPMLVLETALPAKFGQTIEDALGTPAPRRAGLENLESLPQRVVAITQDVEALKARIADQALL